MQVNSVLWSEAEQDIAQSVFRTAYAREINALIQELRLRSAAMTQAEDVWSIHDYLSARRHDMDGKYEFSYPVLMFVLAQLVKERWLTLEELEGLEQDKIAKISALARMS